MPVKARAPRRAVQVLVGLVSLLGGEVARAFEAESRARLDLSVAANAENCISAEELERAVEVELGQQVFVHGEAPSAVTIHVRVQREADQRYRASVNAESNEPSSETGAPGALREVSSDSGCRGLDEPLTLIVALLAEGELGRAERKSAERDEPLPPDPEPAPPKDDAPLEPVSSAPNWEALQKDARWGFEIDALATSAFGLLPNVALGAELGFLAKPPALPAFRLRALVLTSKPEEPVPGASVSFVYPGGGVALCPELLAGAWGGVRACLGVDVGAIRAESSGLVESHVAWSVLAQFGLAVRGTLELGSGWLGTLGAGVTVPTKNDRYVYRDDGTKQEIFEMAVAPLFVTLGVSHDFR